MKQGVPLEQVEMLRKVQEADFVLVELQLYLDTHPDDAQALMQFREATKWAKHARKQYEAVYGPLNIHSVPSKELLEAGWRWDQPPWPWQI